MHLWWSEFSFNGSLWLQWSPHYYVCTLLVYVGLYARRRRHWGARSRHYCRKCYQMPAEMAWLILAHSIRKSTVAPASSKMFPSIHAYPPHPSSISSKIISSWSGKLCTWTCIYQTKLYSLFTHSTKTCNHSSITMAPYWSKLVWTKVYFTVPLPFSCLAVECWKVRKGS